MKSKKLISFLCAAALTASSFAGLAVTASAADGDDLLTLTDFSADDIQAAGSTAAAGKWLPANSKQTVTAETDDKGTYLKSTIQTGEGSTYNTTYTLATPVTASEYVIEFDTSIHKSNGMGRIARMNQVAFTSSSAAMDTRKYGTDTGAVYASGIAASLNARWELDGLLVNDLVSTSPEGSTTTVNVADDQWVRVQAAVNTTTHKATVTIINAAGAKIVDAQEYDADATSLDAIHLIPGRGDANVSGQGIVCLDNVHVYTGAAKTLTTDGLRGTVEIAYEDAAPVPEAPGKVEKLTLGLAGNDDISKISNNDKGRLIFLGTEAQEFTDLETVNLAFPQHSNDRSDTQWKVNTANTDPALGLNDKYLQAVNSTDSTATRGGRMYFKKDGALYEVAEREAVVAQFAARLHKGTDTAEKKNPAELIFSGDMDSSGSKQNLQSPLAMVTTDATASSATYAVDHGLNTDEKKAAHVLQVNDNEWFLVEIEAYHAADKTTAAKIKITTFDEEGTAEDHYILGAEDSRENITNATGNSVNNLPYISFRSGNSDDYGVSNSKNDIDNIYLYSTTVDPEATPTPSPTPSPTPQPKHDVTITNEGETVSVTTTESTAFNAVLIHAKYDGTKLTKAKAYNLTGISSAAAKTQVVTDTVNSTDKFFVWESLASQIPYGSANATGPAAPTPTPTAGSDVTPTPTAGSDVTPTPTAGSDVTPTPTAGSDVTPTPTAGSDDPTPTPTNAPTPTPTAVPTYTASISGSTTVNIAKKPADGEATYAKTNVTELSADDVVTIKSDSDDKTLVSVKYTVGTDVEQKTANATDGVAEITVAGGDIAIVSATFTYNSVAIKADANVASVTLGTTTIEKAQATAPSGEETNYTYTFTNVAEGKNALAATYATGYEAAATVTTPVTIPLAADITITSKASEYAITYVLNDGTNADDAPAKYTYGVGATLPTPTKQYKTFDGWFTSATPAQDDVAVTTIGTTETGAKTFYAKWNDITYTIADGNVENATVTLPDPATGVIGDEVEITVVAAADHAISKVEIKKDDNVVVEATKGANNKYTFTVANTDVTAVTVVPTVIAAASESDEIAKVVVSPATATVTQGTNDTAFSAEVQNASNAPFLGDKSQVTWSVAATDTEKTKKSGTTISETGVLTVAADEEETLTITATASDGTTKGTATVTVNQTEGTVTLTYKRASNNEPLENVTVTPSDGSYVLASVAAFETFGTTDENGQVTLTLNPSKEYTITATYHDEVIDTKKNFKTTTAQEADKTVAVGAVNAETASKVTLNSEDLEIDPANPIPGDTVTVSVKSDAANKYITALSAKNQKDEPENVVLTPANADAPNADIIESATFTMPASGITLTPTVATLYAVTFADTDDYTFTVTDKDNAAVTSGKLFAEDTELTVAVAAKNAKKVATAAIDAEGPTSTLVEGKLTVKEDTALTATVADKTYTITVVDDIANGTVTADPTSAAEEAQVTLTVAPAAGYHLKTITATYGDDKAKVTLSEPSEVENSDNTTYTFQMPAGNVSVEAVFEETINENRVPDESASVIAVYDNEHATNQTEGAQTLRDGTKSYSELSEGSTVSLSSDLKQAYNKIYTVFDMKLDNGDTLTIRGQNDTKGSSFSGRLLFVAADDSVKVQTDVNSNGATDYGTTTLETGTWYKVVVTATYVSNASTSSFDFAAYPVTVGDGTEAVDDTAAVSGTMTARNISTKEYAVVEIGVSGTPAVDNFYVYTDAKHAATVTVKDEKNAPIEGVSVTLNNAAKTNATTNAQGVASLSAVVGTYDVTVAKSGYIAPTTTPQLTVAKIDDSNTANNVDVSMTAKVKTTLEVTAPDNKELLAGDPNGITYTAVVKDQNGDAMTAEEAPVTWSILDAAGENEISDGTITVVDGKITATSEVTAGTYTVKAVAGGSTTAYTNTFTVKVLTPASVTVNYQVDGVTKETTTIAAGEGAFVDAEYTLPASYYEGVQQFWVTENISFKRYSLVEGTDTSTLKVTPSAATGAEINVPVTTDDITYFYYNDFESYDVDTAIASIPGFSGSTSVIKAGATGQGKVLWLRGGGTWTAKNWSTNVATPITATNVAMEFDIHYGYFGGTKNTTWTLNNSDGESIVKVVFDNTGCKISEISIKGTAQDISKISNSYQSNNNYTDTGTAKPHIKVIVDYNNDMASVTLSQGDKTDTYKASIAGLTSENVAAWVDTSSVNNNDRCATINDFKVYQTTETLTAE